MRRAIWKLRVRRALAGGCVTVAGCAWIGPNAFRRSADGAREPDDRFAADAGMVFNRDRSSRSGVGADAVVAVQLRFDVERFLVPSEALDGRRAEMWNHVDELRGDPATSALLAQNGFQVGVASRLACDAIRALLHDLDASVEKVTHRVQRGIPLTLDMGALGDRPTVFIMGRDGGLAGDTFTGASKLLHVDYEVTLGDRPRTALRMTPEIFKESSAPYWRLRDGDVRYQKQYEGKLYRELSAEFEAGDGEVLVIGPSDARDRPLMLGSIMLSDIVAGRRWETLLCVTPRLYRHAGEQESR